MSIAAGRLRSNVPLLRKMLAVDPLSSSSSSAQRSTSLHRALCPSLSNAELCFILFDIIVLAENGRLIHSDKIAKRFREITMAHKGKVKATITTVIPIPAEDEKELKETLQDIIGEGKKVILEQKIDPSILGGIVVEFRQKVFDLSIKTMAREMERLLREPIEGI